MISRLRGILISKKAPFLVIELQGVGYEVQAPMSTIFQLPDIGQELILYTEFIVREDAHKLFGFLTELERSLFNTITKVSGVGPKLALAILSGLSPQAFVKAIQGADLGCLVGLPGVGKKTAERLVVELKDKLTEVSSESISVKCNKSPVSSNSVQEAKEALMTLGYAPKEAHQAIAQIPPEQLQMSSSEAIIKMALSKLMKISV